MESIGDRILKIIQSKGIKKVEFARRLGINGSYVTHLIKNKNAPSDALTKSICREFNINETWLLTGEGNPTTAVSEDNLDQVLREWGLPREVRSLFLAYRELTDPQKNAVLEFIQKSAEKLASQRARQQQPIKANISTGEDDRAGMGTTKEIDRQIEEEARREAQAEYEAIYLQKLAEKRAEAGLQGFTEREDGTGTASA